MSENDPIEAGDGTETDEYEVCKIDDVGVEDLREYLENEYGDEPELVREHHPEYYDELFDEADETVSEAGNEAVGTAPDEGTSGESAGSTVEFEDGRTTINEEPDSSEDQGDGDSSSQVDHPDMVGMSNKWYLIGVGGAGNRIVDTVLMRQDALENTSSVRSRVWRKALTDYAMLNSNISDLKDTYYAEELNEMGEMELLQKCMIGYNHDENDHTGCGSDWTKGKEYIKHDFETDENLLDPGGRWAITIDKIYRSQAVMIAHSVTGGTGCGAAPELAKHLQDEFDGRKSIFGSVVLPDEKFDGMGPQTVMNGTIGIARMARHADAVIPFQNGELKRMESILIDIAEADRHTRFQDPNRALITFFEIFSMAAIGEQGIKGDDFDISDSLNPIDFRRPISTDYGFDPGAVLAPVLSKSDATSMSESTLGTLVRQALFTNRFVDFKPETAWGGTFVFYGPRDRIDEDLIDSEFRDIVFGKDYLAASGEHPLGVEVDTNYIYVEDLEEVYLWGLLWNPVIESLEEMREKAEEFKGLEFRGAKPVRKNWEVVEALSSMLGRENMGG